MRHIQYCYNIQLVTGWPRSIRCRIFIGHFPQNSHIISNSFAKMTCNWARGKWRGFPEPPCATGVGPEGLQISASTCSLYFFQLIWNRTSLRSQIGVQFNVWFQIGRLILETSDLGLDVSWVKRSPISKRGKKVVGRDVQFEIGRLQTSDLQRNVEKGILWVFATL